MHNSISYRHILFVVSIAALMLSAIHASCQGSIVVTAEQISYLRDSLDAINYPIPQMPRIRSKKKVVKVKRYEEWKTIGPTLKELLEAGHKNIVVKVSCEVKPGDGQGLIQGLDYPEANIYIEGNKATQGLNGSEYSINNPNANHEGAYYSFPYSYFQLDDFIADEKGNEIPLREDVKQVDGDIVKVQGSRSLRGSSDDIWKFKIDLPDLAEEQCKDFYVLMTRDWTSARHKVMKVQDGWLYYHLDSEDLRSERDPNVDWKQYKVRPRYRLINNPVSKGVHITKGSIYVPRKYPMITVRRGARLLTVKNCHLNSMVIRGFSLNGLGKDCVIGVDDNTFETGMFITNNKFSHLSYLGIIAYRNKNLIINQNEFSNTRGGVIYLEGGINITISENKMKRIGWMYNSMAVQANCEVLHILDNVIEDFNYSAISVGSTTPNGKAKPLSYIIERNVIRLTREYTDDYIKNTLADGGGIYIGPQCTQGIIRNNVVENINGVNSNRGIFLDDGAKNLAIYGNYINNTANSYDIDLRYCTTYSAGIPDHNTKNIIIQNIMTGTYRFDDDDNHTCITGENVLLGNMNKSNKVSVLHRKDDLKSIKPVKIDSFVKRHM